MSITKFFRHFSGAIFLLAFVTFLFVYGWGTKTPEYVTDPPVDPIADEIEFMDLLHKTVEDGENSIDVFKFGYNAYDVQRVANYYSYEHPENAMYYDVYAVNRYAPASDYVESIYLDTGRVAAAQGYANMIDQWSSNVILNMDPDLDDEQKVLWINQYIIENYEYDDEDRNWDLADMLETGKGVCSGYTQMFTVLARKAGLEVSFAQSNALNHVWNVVKVDGEWYNVDVTWNDSSGQDHMYLLLSDAEMQRRHELLGDNGTVSMQIYACSTSRYDNIDQVWFADQSVSVSDIVS